MYETLQKTLFFKIFFRQNEPFGCVLSSTVYHLCIVKCIEANIGEVWVRLASLRIRRPTNSSSGLSFHAALPSVPEDH